MTVELLNNENQGGILDLTNKGETHEEEAQEELTPEGEVLEQEVSGTDLDSEESEAGSGSDVPDGDDDSDSSEADESVDEEYYFGEDKVAIEVPDEIASALKDAGIESSDLLKQLFKKGGDFSLEDETRSKLEEKFGKHMVDGYLSMYKNMNEQSLAKSKEDQKAQEATLEQQKTQYAEAVGGEEGLQAMEGYILENLNEKQIAAYNSVMENGDHESQLLIISQLRTNMELADKFKNGDKKLELVGDKEGSPSSAGSPLDKGFLTKQELDKIMESEEYWTNREYMNRVDKARMVGIKSGK